MGLLDRVNEAPEEHSVARLAQSVEHENLNLRVVGSSPTLGEVYSEHVQHVKRLYQRILEEAKSTSSCCDLVGQSSCPENQRFCFGSQHFLICKSKLGAAFSEHI